MFFDYINISIRHYTTVTKIYRSFYKYKRYNIVKCIFPCHQAQDKNITIITFF